MYLNSSILLETLSAHLTVEQGGAEIEEFVFGLPRLFQLGTCYEDHQVYVGKAEDFTAPPGGVNCLLVGVGGRFPTEWSKDRCCLFSLPHATSVEQVMNLLIEGFEQYEEWDRQLCDILLHDGDLIRMIRITEPIVGNPIAFTNNRGKILANIQNQDFVDPSEYSLFAYIDVDFWDYYIDNCKKEGFHFYRHQRGYFYFANIYRNKTYVGVLTLQEFTRPLTAASCSLFRHFYSRICLAVEHENNLNIGTFDSIKSIIVNLLQGNTVGYLDSNRIRLRRGGRIEEPKCWMCAVIQPLVEEIPFAWDVYCKAVEDAVVDSVAVHFDSYVAVLIPLQGDVWADNISNELRFLLKHMQMRAGLSDSFTDLSDFRAYYRQAVHALRIGSMEATELYLYHFRDYAMNYMLRNTCGDIPVNCLLPESLLQLRPKDSSPSSVDYWATLKTYLDNEMNTAQTARDLYIHRSTLQTRLDRIAEIIPLDTPEQRFLARYYLYLYEFIKNYP